MVCFYVLNLLIEYMCFLISNVSLISSFFHDWNCKILIILFCIYFPGVSDGKASAYTAGDLGSIPGLGRSPGEENGNPLQCSGLENPMDRGAWQATVHGVAKSQTQLSLTSLLHLLYFHIFTCLLILSFCFFGVSPYHFFLSQLLDSSVH